MNALWSYFWPLFAAGLVIGAITGVVTFRGRRQARGLIVGAALTLAAAAWWHGPLGAASSFTAQVERGARQTLVYYDMTRVQARLHRGPLSRQVQLAGPADDFQRSELVRIIGEIPGVSRASWSASRGLPLIVEGLASALAGFALGLVLAYLVELRRRHNAQWKW